MKLFKSFQKLAVHRHNLIPRSEVHRLKPALSNHQLSLPVGIMITCTSVVGALFYLGSIAGLLRLVYVLFS